MILIKFFDWMRGILTMEPRIDAEVIMIPLKNDTLVVNRHDLESLWSKSFC